MRVPRYLLVSVGTGTSILLVDGASVTRIGGTALGGGTLLGLAAGLLGTSDFDEIAALAQRGSRQTVDLLVSDIYPAGGIALAGDLTAANFGKYARRLRDGERDRTRRRRARDHGTDRREHLAGLHGAQRRRRRCSASRSAARRCAAIPALAEMLGELPARPRTRSGVPAERRVRRRTRRAANREREARCMTKPKPPVAIEAASAPPRTQAFELSGAVRVARGEVARSDRSAIASASRTFGVNHTRLAPGGQSALHHRHSKQDEFIYVLEGEPTLVSDAGETQLRAGHVRGLRRRRHARITSRTARAATS